MAMYRLAEHFGQGPLSLREIADMENISEAYLEQLFSNLKKNQLVNSIRGAGGGYELAKPPKEIPIGDILNALEGEFGISCSNTKSWEDCEKISECATKDILDKIQREVEKVMQSMSLADM